MASRLFKFRVRDTSFFALRIYNRDNIIYSPFKAIPRELIKFTMLFLTHYDICILFQLTFPHMQK